MDAGLVTSMSGALAQSKRVEVIANNLANADTPGFKADDIAFEESLLGAHQADMRSDIPEEPFKDSELFSRSGDERRPVLYGGEFTQMRAGGYRQTGNSLDVAIEGNGFLQVLTPKGIRLTRAGNLALDPQGRLVNRDGFLVLGPGETAKGPTATASLTPTSTTGVEAGVPEAPDAAAAARAITVGSNQVHIDAEGNIYSRNAARTILGRLGIVQIENPSGLIKEGGNTFLASPEAFVKKVATGPESNSRDPASVNGDNPDSRSTGTKPNPLGSTLVAPKVHQGMLEGSNVNPVAEMTRMIEAHRMFDQNSKLMQMHGDMTGRLSEIGKF